MISTLILSIVVLHIFLCFKHLAYGAAFLIAVRQIIPAIARFGPLSLNTSLLVILLVFCLLDYWLHKNKSLYKFDLFPIVFLTIPLAILGLFAETLLAYQFKQLVQFSLTELLPYVVLIYSFREAKDIKMTVKVVFLSYIIVGIYGIFTFWVQANPLVILFAYSFEYEGDLYLGDDGNALRGALDGRASGNMTGSLPWGQYSLLVLLFSVVCPLEDSKKWRLIVILLSFLNCILTTKRSVIAPAFIALIYYLICHSYINRKRVLVNIMGISFLIVLLFRFPIVQEVFENNIMTSVLFWDDSYAEKRNISGSSRQMRFEQMQYLNQLVSDNPLFGKGFGYKTLYVEKYQNNTPVAAFESIFLETIIDSGYLGLMVWLLFIFRCYKRTSGFSHVRYSGVIFHGLFFLSLTLTGNQVVFYGYMIFTAILIGHNNFCKTVICKSKI